MQVFYLKNDAHESLVAQVSKKYVCYLNSYAAATGLSM
nr:MAG TPA: hypothetical protein [Caudoviricetes sp.]